MNASDLVDNAKWTEYLFDLAERRLYKLGLTDEQAAYALYDWPDGDEHLKWLILAPAEDILEWGEEGDWGREDA